MFHEHSLFRHTEAVLIVDIIIPALNEEDALPLVLRAIPKDLVRHVVVADNGSEDATAEVAEAEGAIVVREPERGYGAACLRAMAHLQGDPPDVVVFLDGDHSDDATELPALLAPFADGADLVIGSRVRGDLQPGALTVPQRVGNAIACAGLRLLYGARYTDLGPFRAIRWNALKTLRMNDRNWGWTVEMQIRAALAGMNHVEIPVSYRVRGAGESKVSGTIKGSVNAGRKILWLLARHRLLP